MKDLHIVIGASSGYGLAIAEQLSVLGTVITAQRSTMDNSAFGSVTCDARKIKDVQALADTIQAYLQQGYKLTSIVYSAGIAANLLPIGKKSLSDVQDVFLTNTEGLYFALHCLIPLMTKGSTFVYVGSISETKNYYGGGEYCASKAAAWTLMRTARIENMTKGIRFTTVSPGMAMTHFHATRFKNDNQKIQKTTGGIQPLQTEDVARLVVVAVTQPPHVCINHLEVSPTDQAEHGEDIRKYKKS